MASIIIFVFYAVIIISYLTLSFFIIYHLANYGINSEFKVLMLILFIAISAGLLIINAAYFFSIDWNHLISQLLN